MPFDLLLLPLLGGYILVTQLNITKIAVARYSGQRLIFASAIAGVVLVVASRIFVMTTIHLTPEVGIIWKQYVLSHQFSGTAFSAFLLGIFGIWPINKIYNEERSLNYVLNHYADEQSRFFYQAMVDERLVQITLSDGKVYVGLIQSTALNILHTSNAYVSILPTVSGYRKESSRKVKLTTFYDQIYEAIKDGKVTQVTNKDFVKVIPVGMVTIAGIFQEEVYTVFQDNYETGT